MPDESLNRGIEATLDIIDDIADPEFEVRAPVIFPMSATFGGEKQRRPIS